MTRMLTVALVAVMAIIFAADNMHHVELGLIFGRPVNVRLFFLLLTSFLLGCLVTVFVNLYVAARSRRGDQKTRGGRDDEFFSE